MISGRCLLNHTQHSEVVALFLMLFITAGSVQYMLCSKHSTTNIHTDFLSLTFVLTALTERLGSGSSVVFQISVICVENIGEQRMSSEHAADGRLMQTCRQKWHFKPL